MNRYEHSQIHDGHADGKHRPNSKAEAIDWLREKFEHDGVEGLDPDKNDDFDFADGLDCVIDHQTLELIGFTIVPKAIEEQVHTFSFQAPWGECRLVGVPNKNTKWITEPDFKLSNESEGDAATTEATYQASLDACFDLNWFDPANAWCPEDPTDLPLGWIENALESLGQEARFFAVGDDESNTLLICRTPRESDLVIERHRESRELSLADAVHFINMNYGDCFDWCLSCRPAR